MTTTRATTIGNLDRTCDVLAFARARRADADRAEADVLAAAALWAEQHPPESIADAATWIAGGGDTGLPLAGPGAPLVAEFCIAEFALAIGRTTDSGRAFIADAVELKYRLPRHWARTQTGRLQVWKARRIAQATLGLSMEAATHVDRQLAAFAHKTGPAALDRLVEEAVSRFMPATALADARHAADGRHVTFYHQQVSCTGTTHLEAELDLADALDLDAALARGAESLAAAGCGQSLDVRRARAAGDIARRQLALDLSVEQASSGRAAAKARQVVLYVHLSQEAVAGTGTGLDLARVENHRQVVTADQVRGWCANPDTAVTVKPVMDLVEHLHTGAYEVPERLAEQVRLRDHTCVFPWCTRPARTCDSDHGVPHAQGGSTCSCNLAPLCRRHHR
jgi:hypothetical protein